MKRFDLIIAGGGPAGAAAAITAARLGARVLILESGRLPRHKVCGEFISAEACTLLWNLLGPDYQMLVSQAPRTTEARFFVDDSIVRFAIAPAASIPRYELDASLWHAAENAGVDCRQEVTVNSIIRRNNDEFDISTTAGRFVARSVVDASGRWSKLGLDRGAPIQQQPNWIGLKSHFRNDVAGQWTTDLYFFSGGYCGVQPVGDGEINVCAMVRAGAATKLHSVFARHPALYARSRPWTPVTEAVSTFPLLFREPQPEHDCVLCVGDAAAFIDPFVGDGISIALRSGALAGNILSACWDEERSLNQAARQYRHEYRQRFAPALRTAGRLRRIMDAPRPLRRMALGIMRLPSVASYIYAHTR